MKKIILQLCLIVLAGCTPEYLRDELRILEKELGQREMYTLLQEQHNDELKALLVSAESDSLIWEYANSLSVACMSEQGRKSGL